MRFELLDVRGVSPRSRLCRGVWISVLWLVLSLVAAPALYAAPADQYKEEYRYDDLGRLDQTVYTDTSSGLAEAYVYDAAGNRIRKTTAATIFTLKGDSHFSAATAEAIDIERVGKVSAIQRIEVKLTDITAAAGTDYLYWIASAPGVVYSSAGGVIAVDFAAGQTKQTIVLEAYPSAQYGESVKAEIQNPQDQSGGGYVPAADTAIGVKDLTYVVDAGGAAPYVGPATFVFAGDITVAEGATATITIKRKGDASTSHSVVVRTVDGSAVAPGDYTAVNTTVNFAANEISKTVSVNIANDAISELNETLSFAMISVSNNGVIGTPDAALVTISGTAQPTATLRVLDTSVVEDGTAQVTILRDGDVSQSQTFTVCTMAGSAVGADVSIATLPPSCSWQRNLAAGHRMTTFSIQTTQDTLVEGNEYFWMYVTRYDATSPGGSDPIAQITILDDDGPAGPAPSSPVSFAFAGNVTVTEGQTASVTITRTGDASSAHTVMVQTVDGSAQTDFTSASSAEDFGAVNTAVRFNAGELSKTIEIPTIADSLTETNETFAVVIRSVDNAATMGTPEMALVTISGTGDPVTTLRVLDTSVVEGGTAEITILRDGDVSQSQTFTICKMAGSAGGADVSGATVPPTCPTTRTLAAGQQTTTFSVPTTQDTLVEGTEYVWLYVTRYDASSPGSSDPIARITITDDDTAASMSISDATVTEGGTAALTVTRSGSATAIFQSINYAVSIGGADTATSADVPLATGAAVFAPGATTATISVPTTQDSNAESSETFTVTLTGADTYTTLTDGVATVTITDDD